MSTQPKRRDRQPWLPLAACRHFASTGVLDEWARSLVGGEVACGADARKVPAEAELSRFGLRVMKTPGQAVVKRLSREEL